MHCLYCDSDDHPWFNCRKRPEGWKPPKKLGAVSGDAMSGLNHPRKQPDVQQATIAETAAVDHRSQEATIAAPYSKGRPRMDGPSQGKSKRAQQMRDYQRQRRAKAKQEKPE